MKLITSPRKVAITAFLVIVHQTKQTFAIDQGSTIIKEEDNNKDGKHKMNQHSRRVQTTACKPGTLYSLDQRSPFDNYEFVSIDINTFASGQDAVLIGNTGIGLSDIGIADAGAAGLPNDDFIYLLNSNNSFYKVNKATGITTTLGFDVVPLFGQWTGLAFDLNTEILYGLSSQNGATYIGIIDPVTGSVTDTSIFVNVFCGLSLAINGQSVAYIHDCDDNNIYSIDLNTLSAGSNVAATLVGPTGFQTGDTSGMSWDPSSDVIYMTSFICEAELRSVNIDTGEATLIGIINSSIGEEALFGFAAFDTCGYSGGGSKSSKGSKTSKSNKASKSKAGRR